MARNRFIIAAVVIAVAFGLVIWGGIGATLLALRWMATPTPTNTAIPTWTASLTPSPTATQTNTPTPSLTPTATPTFTPAPTQTPTPTETPTATSTPTTKPRPIATDTPIPAPSNTPKPALAWTGTILDGFENCAQTRLFGFTRAQDDKLIGGVWIHFWGEGAANGWSMSAYTLTFGADTKWVGDEGNWEAIIDKKTRRAGTWHVCTVPAENSSTCISNTLDVTTDTNCRKGTQVLWIDFRQN
jgi:hypothetical protein